MTDSEILTKLATLMGWKPFNSDEGGYGSIYYRAMDGCLWLYEYGSDVMFRNWNPITSIADAFEVQAKIEATGEKLRYAACLHLLLDEQTPNLSPSAFLFAIANASPRDRCAAMVKCLEDGK